MSSLTCCICFESYGLQSDGSFLCEDGKFNSNFAEGCKHSCCYNCCVSLYDNMIDEVRCPICREDWTEWIQDTYDFIQCEVCDEKTYNYHDRNDCGCKLLCKKCVKIHDEECEDFVKTD